MPINHHLSSVGSGNESPVRLSSFPPTSDFTASLHQQTKVVNQKLMSMQSRLIWSYFSFNAVNNIYSHYIYIYIYIYWEIISTSFGTNYWDLSPFFNYEMDCHNVLSSTFIINVEQLMPSTWMVCFRHCFSITPNSILLLVHHFLKIHTMVVTLLT